MSGFKSKRRQECYSEGFVTATPFAMEPFLESPRLPRKAQKDADALREAPRAEALGAIRRLLDLARKSGEEDLATAQDECKGRLWERQDDMDVVSLMAKAGLPLVANDFAKTTWTEPDFYVFTDALSASAEARVARRIEALAKAGLRWGDMGEKIRLDIEDLLLESFDPKMLRAAQAAGMDAQASDAERDSMFHAILCKFLVKDQRNAASPARVEKTAAGHRDDRLFQDRADWLVEQIERGGALPADPQRAVREFFGPAAMNGGAWAATRLWGTLESVALRAAAGDALAKKPRDKREDERGPRRARAL
jgi:hypothetical protein